MIFFLSWGLILSHLQFATSQSCSAWWVGGRLFFTVIFQHQLPPDLQNNFIFSSSLSFIIWWSITFTTSSWCFDVQLLTFTLCWYTLRHFVPAIIVFSILRTTVRLSPCLHKQLICHAFLPFLAISKGVQQFLHFFHLSPKGFLF